MKKLTFKIITFGCRTNQAESRQIGEKLINATMQQSNFAKATLDKCDNGTMANVVIINTCCVTGKAEKEVRQAIRKVKKENPDCFLVVCGCFAENILRSIGRLGRASRFSSPSIAKRMKSNSTITLSALANIDGQRKFDTLPASSKNIFSLVDLLVGNKDKKKIDKILKKQFIHHPLSINHSVYQDKYSKSKKALVKIQDGCNNFCTYCIVPYVRGRSISRPADEIVDEIRRLIKQGIEEVVLTGIDIADYKFKIYDSRFKKKVKNLKLDKYKNNLVKLIKLILIETKVKRISFGSMGIEVFDREFIGLYDEDLLRSTRQKFFSSNRARIESNQQFSSRRDAVNTKKENFCWSPRKSSYKKSCILSHFQSTINNRLSSHFHIPIQSGCDATLKRMGRKYKISNVKFLISNLKEKIPGFTFSTDIIVGFPGETEEEFKESFGNIKAIKKLLGKRFTKIHVFRYSPREDTVAGKMESHFAKASRDKGKWGRVDEKTKKKRISQMVGIIPSGS